MTRCTYSATGDLLDVTLPNATVIEYVYDPLGRRAAKKINGAVTEKYLWQGQTTLLAVYDGADTLLMRFDYANDRVPVSMTKDGATYYLSHDHLGSLRLVADGFGNTVTRIEYDSFGNILYETNPVFPVPLGFTGGLHDRDTGLVRWTAKDPIGFAGGDTDLYGYVMNDPVNGVDPWGLAIVGIFGSPYQYWKNFFGSFGDFYRNHRDMRNANTIRC